MKHAKKKNSSGKGFLINIPKRELRNSLTTDELRSHGRPPFDRRCFAGDEVIATKADDKDFRGDFRDDFYHLGDFFGTKSKGFGLLGCREWSLAISFWEP